MIANYQTNPINPFVFKPLMLIESARDDELAWRHDDFGIESGLGSQRFRNS
jgi:hypothetical protein